MAKKTAQAKRHENQQRRLSNLAAKRREAKQAWRLRHPLDTMALWVGRRQRGGRVTLAIALTAIQITCATVLLFGAIFSLNADQLRRLPIALADLIPASALLLVVLALILYWLSWRFLLGFAQTLLVPKRAAALWLCFSALLVLATIAYVIFIVAQALGPVTPLPAFILFAQR
jgi:hypothetical protein